MAAIVVGGIGKNTIIPVAINRHHSQQHCHCHHRLNPTATAIDNNLLLCNCKHFGIFRYFAYFKRPGYAQS
jgi:hypothetical protein